jgi:hypothetical protein
MPHSSSHISPRKFFASFGSREILPALCCLTVVAAIAVPPLFLETIVLNRALIDFHLVLDTMQRWRFGHWPHIDYQTPIGAAFWVVLGVGTEIVGTDPRALFVANLLSASFIGFAGYWILRDRMTPTGMALVLSGLVLIVVAPRMMGDQIGRISFLAPYNKTGLSLLGLIAAAFILEPLTSSSAYRHHVRVILTGALLIWLIYLKLNFALIAILVGLAALFFIPRNWSFILPSLAVGIGGAFLFGAVSGIGGAYLNDIAAVAEVGPVFRWSKLGDDLHKGIPSITLVGLCGMSYLLSSQAAWTTRLRTLTLVAGVMLAGILAMNQVHEPALPLAFLALVVLSERAANESVAVKTTIHPRVRPAFMVIPGLACGALLVLLTLYGELETLDYYRDNQAGPRIVRICANQEAHICRISYLDEMAAQALGSLALPSPQNSEKEVTPDAIEAVISATRPIPDIIAMCLDRDICVDVLLRRQLVELLNLMMRPDDRPLYLGFSNFLPYFYDLEPPRRVLAWYDMDRTLLPDSHPDPAAALSDVTLLVSPRLSLLRDYEPGLEDVFAKEIENRFVLIVQTEAWSIWRTSGGNIARSH